MQVYLINPPYFWFHEREQQVRNERGNLRSSVRKLSPLGNFIKQHLVSLFFFIFFVKLIILGTDMSSFLFWENNPYNNPHHNIIESIFPLALCWMNLIKIIIRQLCSRYRKTNLHTFIERSSLNSSKQIRREIISKI